MAIDPRFFQPQQSNTLSNLGRGLGSIAGKVSQDRKMNRALGTAFDLQETMQNAQASGQKIPMVDRETYATLIQNEATRPILAQYMQARERGTDPQFRLEKGPDGITYQIDTQTGKRSVLHKSSGSGPGGTGSGLGFKPTSQMKNFLFSQQNPKLTSGP